MLNLKPSVAIFVLLFIPFLIACGKNGTVGANTLSSELPATPIGDDNDGSTSGETPVAEEPINFKVNICSPLSLTGVTWTSSLDAFDVNAIALAMNISGSFEGHTGWSNLTNNFDGQGISLGLFNQNLGQGSLQPMMISFRDNNNARFKSFFSTAQYTSMNSMLNKWKGTSSVSSKALKVTQQWDKDYSDLDDPSAMTDEDFAQNEDGGLFNKAAGAASSTKNQASVDWAVANVFTGSSFKAIWKTSLQNMAKSPEYVSLQIKSAQSIHTKAEGYMKTFSMTSLRGYLFFFDIVVQNGGISTTIKNKYLDWAKSNKSASENTRLKKLLEYRLTVVRSEYVNDVKSRKTAIIDGKGTVHGSKRDFAKEYCVGSWSLEYALKNLNLL